MLKIDNNLLVELGLGNLPEAEKNSFLRHIYETLEMRVGIRLADQMTNQQLDEFEQYFEAKDDAGAFKWLETNFPNYKDIVQQEFDKLKSEVGQAAPQILAASQAAAGQSAAPAQPAMPVDPAQAPAPVAPPSADPMSAAAQPIAAQTQPQPAAPVAPAAPVQPVAAPVIDPMNGAPASSSFVSPPAATPTPAAPVTPAPPAQVPPVTPMPPAAPSPDFPIDQTQPPAGPIVG
ncbi:MAG TPA: DUF5663 domain-containing protein [Candidatus Saccharimonadales bacterium]|nr:DUF5663 domain-containing protein [Candidatus Saccharimonadales bacterium]